MRPQEPTIDQIPQIHALQPLGVNSVRIRTIQISVPAILEVEQGIDQDSGRFFESIMIFDQISKVLSAVK